MSAAVDVVERLLLEAVDRKTSQPAEALHAISTAITSSQTAKWHFQRKVSSLCPAAAAALRSLVYQALHGLAPERLRDQSMAALATIICPDSSFIDHLWTIEKHEMSSTATGSKLGGFAMFLCSILRGEVHLLREELECYYQGGEAPEGVLKNRDGRHARALSMVGVTCRLVGLVLELLVGRVEQEEREEEEEEEGGAWSHLPSEPLLQVRQSMHSVLQDMMSHLRFVGDELASGVGFGETRHSLLLVARSFTHVVSVWALEDRGLWEPLMDGLPALLRCSLLCRGDCSPMEALRGVGVEVVSSGHPTSTRDVLVIALPTLVAIADAGREGTDAKAIASLCREEALLDALCSLLVAASTTTTPAQVAKDIVGYNSSSASCEETIHQLRSCSLASELLASLLHWQPEAARLPSVRRVLKEVFTCISALEAQPLLLVDDSTDDDNCAQAAYLDFFATVGRLCTVRSD